MSSAGAVYCWGDNGFGQLGDGSTIQRLRPVAVDRSGVLAGVTVTRVSAGANHTCALSSTGAVYCWGFNGDGQLGNGSGTNSARPVEVDHSGALTGRTVTQLSAGESYTCAVAGGAAYCWGSNADGRLGNGSGTNSARPVAVDPSGVLFARTVTQVSTGYRHTCAVAGGAAYCWGFNLKGQLGNNSVTPSPTPVEVDHSGALAGVTLTQVSIGSAHTCAVSSAGAAYCWGFNGPGQLGDGSSNDRLTPVAVDTSGVLVGVTLTQVSTGSYQTCAMSSTGAYCWGSNVSGQLGDGSYNNPFIPVAVNALPTSPAGAPTGVTANAGDTQATVSWTAPSYPGSGTLTGYTATASPGGATCTTSTTTCTLTGLTNGTSYTVTVVANNSDGNSTASTASAAVTPYTLPDAPTNVTAAPANAQATVSWTAPAGLGGSPLTGYTATANPGGATCTTTAATTCTVTGLTNGTAYTFTVVTRTTGGNSPASAPSAPVTPAVPGAPPLPDQEPASDGPLTSSHSATLTAGSRTTLTGTGFAANTPVTIGIYSTPQVLTTTLSDSSGAISAEVTIPTGYTGAHSLVALGLGPDQNTLRALTLRITIADTPTSPTSPTGGGLAVTGPALTATIGLALALLVVGAAAVIAVRRRRPRLTTGTTDGIDLD